MSVAEVEAREIQLEAPSGLWSEAWRRLRRNPGAIVGFVLVSDLRDLALFAPLDRPDGPARAEPRRSSPAAAARALARALFGVDQLGRDLFSRVVYGARYSLLIGVVSVAVGLSVGLVLGAIAGYFGGMRRLRDHAADGHHALDPRTPARDRHRGGARPGLCQIMVAVGVTQIPIFARLLARLDPRAEGERLRAGGALGRRATPDDPRLAHPPERDLAGDRPGNAGARDRDHRRRRARLPRPRPAGSVDAGVGDDADRHDTVPPDGAVPRARSPASRSSSRCSAST